MNFIEHIDNIVKSYGISNYNIQKFRSVYKINSKDRILLIKKFNSKTKLFNTKKIINHLKYNNFKYIQNIYYNLKNEFYFEFENKFYACFSWVDGREVDIKNVKEIKKCTKTIYLFHEAIKNVNDFSMILKDNSDWIEKFEEDIFNLYDIKNKLTKVNSLSELDKFYYENIDKAILKISEIINILNENNFNKFLSENKIICHSSLYYQNFILGKNDKIYLIDFGGISLNNKVYDLARFARRVFYKNSFDTKVLNDIYKVYNKYYKFSEFEKTLFDSYLKHPYKFVKLGYRFYIQNKNMDELKLFNKLKKYCKYELNL